MLIISQGTELSKPLIDAIRATEGTIIKVSGEASKGLKMVPLFIPENVLYDFMNKLNGGDQGT